MLSVTRLRPWLLVLVWDETHSPALLGLTAAARMLPYVACSWWAARVGDRHRRDRVVRATLIGRLVLLAGVPAAFEAAKVREYVPTVAGVLESGAKQEEIVNPFAPKMPGSRSPGRGLR